jgi:Flp pilus assembly protein TadD
MTRTLKSLFPSIAAIFAFTLGLSGCGKKQPSPATTSPAAAVSDRTIDAAISTAESLMNERKWPEAESVLVALIVKAPNHAHAHELLGEVLSSVAIDARDSGQTEQFHVGIEKALASYMKALSLDQTNAGLRHSAGVIADLAGHPEQARALYQRAADLAPDNAQFLLYLAQSSTRAEDYPKAMASLARLIKLDPNEPWAYACLAEVDLAERRFNMALDHIRKARQLDAEEVGFRSTEAKVLRRMQMPKDALELLLALPIEVQLQEVVTFEIATSHAMLGDHMKAAEAWERCYRADPKNWRAACEASEAYIRAGRRDLAKVWLDAALMLAADEPKVHGLQKLFLQSGSDAAVVDSPQ